MKSSRILTLVVGAAVATGALLAPAVSPALAAVPPACQADANLLSSLKSEKAVLTAELRTASPTQKPAIIEQIREVNAQIAVVQPRYDQCLRTH